MQNNIGTSTFKPDNPVIQKIISEYRVSAYKLRKKANGTMWMIILALVVGITIYITADYISNFNYNAGNRYLEGRISDEVLDLNSIVKGINDSIFDPKIEMFDKSHVLYRLDKNTQELNHAINSLKERESNYMTYITFASTLATRIGAILILIFLVQILIRLYRYDTRLAAYYDARANAIELHMHDTTLPFDKIINLLSPDLYDIGSPKSPSESLINLYQRLQPNNSK